MNRRQFVFHSISTLIGLSSIPSYSTIKKYDHQVLLGMFSKATFENVIVTSDMLTKKVHFTKIPLEAHSVIVHPALPNIALMTERWKRKCAIFDLKEKKTIKLFELSPDYQFVGHGTYVPTRKEYLVSTIKIRESGYPGIGLISVFDQNLNFKRFISSGGMEPHDIKLINNKIFVLNAGVAQYAIKPYSFSQCSFTVINPDDLRITSNKKLPTHYTYGHFYHANNKHYLIGGKKIQEDSIKLESSIYIFNENLEKLKIINFPIKEYNLKGPFLSVAVNKKDQISVTNNESQRILLIDGRNDQILHHYTFESSSGVTLKENSNDFLFSAQGKLYQISDNLLFPKSILDIGPYINSAHMTYL